MELEDLGYNSFFETSRRQMELDEFPVARVVAEYKEAYKVRNAKGEYLAKVTGKRMFTAGSREDFPAVGDWVAITELDSGKGVIEAVLPRRTIIQRASGGSKGERGAIKIIATNIDTAFIVEAVDRDYSLNRLERYLAIVKAGGAQPVIIINKVDLLAPQEIDEKRTELMERFPGVDLILSSTWNDQGLDNLRRVIVPGKTYCFLGSSGVGKSSLVNRLLGETVAATGEISLNSGRGKHVTTARQMYFLPTGGIIIDNPGMREVGVTGANEGLEALFDEIVEAGLGCKYSDCTHTHEPGCAVIRAVGAGEVDEEKYSNYLNLKKEAEYRGMNELEKREKDRRFGKFMKNAKKDMKRFGKHV